MILLANDGSFNVVQQYKVKIMIPILCPQSTVAYSLGTLFVLRLLLEPVISNRSVENINTHMMQIELNALHSGSIRFTSRLKSAVISATSIVYGN